MNQGRRVGPGKKAEKQDHGWCLCIATDGEVLVATKTPNFELYLPVFAVPSLTESEAKVILQALCDYSASEEFPTFKEHGSWFFRSDPKTQLDLMHQFVDAVQKEAAKRGR